MIYLFGIYIVASCVVMLYLARNVRDGQRDAAIERRELEDRYMALASQQALLQVQAGRNDDPPLGKVKRGVGEEVVIVG